jgi:hypothetical protein
VVATVVSGLPRRWERSDRLVPSVRAGISGIARLPHEYVARAMERLAADLATGRWQAGHADLMTRPEIDAGYRLVIASS